MTYQNLNDQNDVETITGVVITINRKKDMDLVPVLISVPAEVEKMIESDDLVIEDEAENYYVANSKKGQELLDFVDQMVEVTGVVVKDSSGRKTIYINQYDVIE